MFGRRRYPAPSEDRFRGKISAATLADLWQARYGIDVRKFLTAPQLELVPVPPYNYYCFSNARPGDGQFYATLMSGRGYDSPEKPEFNEAAAEITSQDKVLDVGCGIGNFSTKCRGVYRGIDTNPTAVQDGNELGRSVYLGLVQDEEPNSWDVVTAFQVLEHVEAPDEFLAACIRCLRPGGRLIVTTPNMCGFMGYLYNELLNYPPHHVTWWSPVALESLVKGCGCTPTKIWQEPLQRIQWRAALSALFCPRNEEHLSNTVYRRVLDRAFGFFGRVAGKLFGEIPFIVGQTVMVVARKNVTVSSSSLRS
jgi:SAM-dependent methyltransferase